MAFVHSGQEAVIPGEIVPKTVADILTAAADLIEPEGRWTQGEQARNKRGQRVSDSACNAVCFCASGAIWRAARRAGITGLSSPNGKAIDEAHRALSEIVNRPSHAMSVPDWNDRPTRTQGEVVAALRAAAEKARTAAETGSVGTSGASEPKASTPQSNAAKEPGDE